ncbi:MAG: MFS transporter [Anaerolineaceae bacterium]|nr:MFS transporter [Anaerolineaceae bacterium]
MLKFKEDQSNWKQLFFPIWGGQVFSILGSSLVQFAIVWWMTEQTGSATVLATGSFISFLPQVFLGPFAGTLVDRFNRRKILIIADATVAIFTFGLALLFWFGIIQIWHIFVLLFLRALGGTFHWAALQSSTSMMVPEDQLSRVAGMNQTLQGVVNLGAPPLGALLMSIVSIQWVLSIDIITAVIAITPLVFILIPQPVKSEEKTTKKMVNNMLKETKMGFDYVIKWKGLLYILFLAAIINFLTAPLNTYMPLLVTEYFKGGIWQVGWLETSWGIGVVIGGLTLSLWGGFKKKIITSFTGLIGLSLGIFIISLAPPVFFWIALVGMAITGIANPIINGPFMAIMQSKVQKDMQGRVFSLVSSFCGAMMPLSMIVSAPIVEQFGPRSWYFASAVISLLVTIVSLFSKEIMQIEEKEMETTGDVFLASQPGLSVAHD